MITASLEDLATANKVLVVLFAGVECEKSHAMPLVQVLVSRSTREQKPIHEKVEKSLPATLFFFKESNKDLNLCEFIVC